MLFKLQFIWKYKYTLELSEPREKPDWNCEIETCWKSTQKIEYEIQVIFLSK